jgi:hypothetical protein
MKIVQERAGNTLELTGISNNFLNRNQMDQQLRERTDKCDYMKLKSFYTTKEIVTRLKRLPIDWEKIFASYVSDKGLITRIYRELKKLNSPKINDPMTIWENELNRTFSKEEVQMAKKKNKTQKTHEEMHTIPSHKGNANQNHVNILPHSC